MELQGVWNWVWNCCHLICYHTLETGGGIKTTPSTAHWQLIMPLMISEIFSCLSSQWHHKVEISRWSWTQTSSAAAASLSRSSSSRCCCRVRTPKQRQDPSPSEALWIMTLDGWLEANIRVISNCDAPMASDLKGSCQQTSCWPLYLRQILVATPHQKYGISSLQASPQQRSPFD